MNRRLFAAYLILFLTFLLTIFSHIQIQKITSNVCDELSAIRATVSEQDYSCASQKLCKLIEYYKEQQHFLEFFIKRETVLSIAVNLHGLKAYINASSISDLYSEIDKVTEQMFMMEHLFTAIV